MDNYSTNEIIEMAVQIERSGYSFYQEALKRTDLDDKMKELLEFLSNEEKKHETTFLSMRDGEDKINISTTDNWNTVTSFMKSIVENRIFTDPESAIKKAKSSHYREELLKNALQFEKDTLLLYHSLHGLSEDSKAKNLLENIIVEEMSHITKLALFMND